jgi:DNA-binding SARP family transcriptional activator
MQHVSRIFPLLISQPSTVKKSDFSFDVQLSLFGGFSLFVNDRRVVVSRQHASLISYLARQQGAEISRDRLATLYWGDSPTDQARRNLRVAFSRIKRLLSINNSDAIETTLVHTTLTTASIPNDTSITVDANLFERLLQDNCDIETLSEVKIANIKKAVSLYRECLLPELDEEWVASDRESLRNQYVSALRVLTYHYVAQQDFVTAVAWALRILREEPYDESAAILAMRLLCLHGQRACAIRVYRSLSHQLRTEFGISPSLEAAELFQSISSNTPKYSTFRLNLKEIAASLQVSSHRAWS